MAVRGMHGSKRQRQNVDRLDRSVEVAALVRLRTSALRVGGLTSSAPSLLPTINQSSTKVFYASKLEYGDHPCETITINLS
jgi:hypothetical protein